MRFLFVFVVIMGALLGGAAQAPSTVEVRGVVRDAATGKILRRASVQIGQLYTNSDADGRFSLGRITPGRQLLMVSREDYVLSGIRKPEPGQRPIYRFGGIDIEIPPQSPFEMDVYMSLTSLVSGRVVDTEGRPVEGVSIWAYRAVYDVGGERTFIRGSGPSYSSMTDDRGEFVRSLPPGEYIFRVDSLLNRKPIAATYYPATLDFSKAEVVHVLAGDDIRLRPLILQNPPLLWLTVKPLDETGQEVGGYSPIYVRRVGEPAGLAFLTGSSLRLPAGSYDVESGVARTETTGTSSVQRPARVTRASVEIRDADVTLPITLPRDVKAMVRVLLEKEGEMKPVAGIPVRLVPSGFISTVFQPFTGVSGTDGTWNVGDAPSGSYRVVLPLYSETAETRLTTDRPFATALQSLCVREIRSGDTPIAGDEIRIAGTTANVTIMLRDSNTRIQGTLGVHGGNAIVALIPNDRKQIQRYAATFANADGSFDLKCALPGEYRLYAWTNLPGAAYRNEEFMANYRDRGTPVSVNDGASVTVQTSLIEP